MFLVGMQIEHNKSKTKSHLALKYYEARYPWRDRRSGFDRRRFGNLSLRFEQRSGEDRRCLELPEIIKYRQARTRLRRQLKEYHQAGHALERCLAGGVIILVVIMAMLSVVFFLEPI
jgi:hypothetical protein